MAEQGVTFPIARDQGSQVYNDYFLSGSISPFPRDYIIDQNGIIRYTNVEYDINAMDLIVESLLEEPTTGVPLDGLSTQTEQFRLFQNYPNPFNPETFIEFQLTRRAQIKLAIYDVNGRKIRTLVEETREAGLYSTSWDGTDDLKIPVASGVYFYRADMEGQSQVRMLTLIR